jgi:hypothetical protein
VSLENVCSIFIERRKVSCSNRRTKPTRESNGAVRERYLSGRKLTETPPKKAPVALPTFIAD